MIYNEKRGYEMVGQPESFDICFVLTGRNTPVQQPFMQLFVEIDSLMKVEYIRKAVRGEGGVGHI